MSTRENKSGVKISVLISVVALLVSLFTFYWSSLRPSKLSFFSAPVVQIGRDWKSDQETVTLPTTIMNRGANGSVVSFIKLVVDHPVTNKKKVFESRYIKKLTAIERNFSPITILGNESATESIGFYPLYADEPKILGKGGVYFFTIYFYGPDPNSETLGEISFKHTPNEAQIGHFASLETYTAIIDSWKNSQRLSNN